MSIIMSIFIYEIYYIDQNIENIYGNICPLHNTNKMYSIH